MRNIEKGPSCWYRTRTPVSAQLVAKQVQCVQIAATAALESGDFDNSDNVPEINAENLIVSESQYTLDVSDQNIVRYDGATEHIRDVELGLDRGAGGARSQPCVTERETDIAVGRRTGAIPKQVGQNENMSHPIDVPATDCGSRVEKDEEGMLIGEIEKQRRIKQLRLELAGLMVENQVPAIAGPTNPVLPVCESGELLSGASSEKGIATMRCLHSVVSQASLGYPLMNIPASAGIMTERLRLDDVKLLIAKFTGDNAHPIKKWLRNFSLIMDSLKAQPNDYLRFSLQLLDGRALLFAQMNAFKSWDDFCDQAMSSFHHDELPGDIYRALDSRPRRSGETVRHYVFEMKKIAGQGEISDEEVIRRIIFGLHDRSSAIEVLANSRSLRELEANLPRYEGLRLGEEYRLKSDKPGGGGEIQRSTWGANKRTIGSNAEMVKPKLMDQSKVRYFNCQKPGHFSHECNEPLHPKNRCFGCQQVGHQIKDCPKKTIAMMQSNPNEPAGAEGPNWNAMTREGEDDELDEQQQVRVDWTVIGNSKRYINARSLIDTGSYINCIRRSGVPSQFVTYQHPIRTSFRGIGNNNLKFFGIVKCQMTFKNRTNFVTCYILPDEILPFDLLLGRDFIHTFGIVLHSSTFFFSGSS